MKNKNEFYAEIVSAKLSGHRLTHSIKTAEMCRELARAHNFDPEKAYLTGILHDICKEEDESEVKRLAHQGLFGQDLDIVEREERKLWHAPAGATYIKEMLGVNDDEIIWAVRFHTVGRAGMSKLEKILYLGDLVEQSREYPEIEKFRRHAFNDLDSGMYEALSWALMDNLQRKKLISRHSYEAYNHYLGKKKG